MNKKGSYSFFCKNLLSMIRSALFTVEKFKGIGKKMQNGQTEQKSCKTFLLARRRTKVRREVKFVRRPKF